jgi:hypothetical protein
MIGWKAKRMLRWEKLAGHVRRLLKEQEIIRLSSKYDPDQSQNGKVDDGRRKSEQE